MKKASIILLGIVVVSIVFFALGGDRLIKNSIGSFLGYGTCPNCGDSWWWKENGVIDMDYGQPEKRDATGVISIKEGKGYTIEGEMPGISITVTSTSGVMICNECLAHPERLDPDKIALDLISTGWGLEKVALVKNAVKRYIKEKTGTTPESKMGN